MSQSGCGIKANCPHVGPGPEEAECTPSRITSKSEIESDNFPVYHFLLQNVLVSGEAQYIYQEARKYKIL